MREFFVVSGLCLMIVGIFFTNHFRKPKLHTYYVPYQMQRAGAVGYQMSSLTTIREKIAVADITELTEWVVKNRLEGDTNASVLILGVFRMDD